jgi:cytochrome c
MDKIPLEPAGLRTGRLALIFALLSLIFVAVLASAPLLPYFAEWRAIQQNYNDLARKSGQPEIPIAVQQIWKLRLGISDRCVTCHLGAGTAGPVPGNSLFKAHPAIPHDPREYGCTVCHGGQGRATRKADAHGFVSHWDEEMLAGTHLFSGCGACHNRAPAVTRADLEGGLRLIDGLDCLSCHRMDGRGRGKAPDLTYAGIKGYPGDWHARHLAEQAKDTTGQWASSYGAISDDDLRRIDAVLASRIGMPRVVEAQAVALERGCLGCHKIGGRGGEEGPALDAAGRKPTGDLNFTGVDGEHTLVNYMRRHFLDPGGVVPGSLMPAQAATVEEADLLTSYVLFLRAREFPPEFLPKSRLRSSLLGEKPPPLTGSQTFKAYCTGCHGTSGEGRNFGNLAVRFPAIGSADFLAVASDAFILSTLKTGRPARRMPALAASGAAIGPEELPALVSHLRSLEPVAPSFASISRLPADANLGALIYRDDCAACHGVVGEGTPLGSPLVTADSRTRGQDDAAYKALVEGVPSTAMPRYRAYPPTVFRSLLSHVAAQARVAGSRAGWKMGTGAAQSGRALYARICAGCHGANGEGKIGPALGNSGFLNAATTEYIAATVLRGRSGTPMPRFGRDSAAYPRLTAQDALDITAFIRSGFAERKGN